MKDKKNEWLSLQLLKANVPYKQWMKSLVDTIKLKVAWFIRLFQ